MPLQRRVVCLSCGKRWRINSIDDLCTRCGRPYIDPESPRVLTCGQCGYSWIRRNEELPRKCPVCCSLLWNSAKRTDLTCSRCGHTWTNRTREPSRCPCCQSSMWKVPRMEAVCQRCGHMWIPRKGEMSEIRSCPRCKTKNWNGMTSPDVKAESADSV